MQKRDLARAFYRQGVDAMEHADWSRAVEWFIRCCRLDPPNAMYRALAEKCSNIRNSRL